MTQTAERVLVTGATGFVGSHLCDVLLAHGFEVVRGTRHPKEASAERPGMRFCHIDLADRASVDKALGEVDRAVYLVHGMRSSGAYGDIERQYAETFRDAAATRKLARVVYLGGMRPRGEASRHLASRLKTGEILRGGPVPVVELRATMIVGGGSESFRIVRDLAARLPGMLLPKWMKSLSEPVAIDDIVEAIAHALTMPIDGSEVLTAPGREAISGRDVLLRTARVMGHEPVVVDVPFVSPRLSSYWIRLVTRADPHVATELVEGLRTSIVADGPTIWERMPGFERTPFDEAVRRALAAEKRGLPLASRMVEGFVHGITPEAQTHTS